MAGDSEYFNKAMNDGHSAAWDQSWEKAASYYRLALKEFPEDPKALTSLALAYLEMGDFREALVHYQKAARVTPEDPIPLEKVSELMERIGRIEQAVEAYMRAADLYVKNRDVNKGIDLWNHVISLNPEVLLAHSRLAMIYERLGRKAEAVKAYLLIAAVFQHHGDVQKAGQAVNKALQIQPDNAEAGQALNMLRIGRMLPRPMAVRPQGFQAKPTTGPLGNESDSADQGESKSANNVEPVAGAHQKAIANLAGLVFDLMDESASSASSSLETILNSSQASSRSGKTADLGKIIAHLNASISALTTSQDSQALEELNSVVEVGLDHPAVTYLLGCLMIDANRLESGVRMLQRLSSHPEYGFAACLLLGQTYLKMNRRRESAENLMMALRSADLRVAHPTAANSLVQAYDPLIEAYQQGNSKEPSEQLCQNILSLLKRPDWREQVLRARQQLPSNDSPVADLITEAGGSDIVGLLANIQRLARAGQHHTAMEEAYYALISAPTYLPLHVTIGDILLSQGQTSEAAKKFETTARAYAAREDTGKAVALFRRVIELSPLDMDAKLKLVDMLMEGGLYAEAVEEYLGVADIYYTLADMPNVRSTLVKAQKLAHERNLSRGIRMNILNRIGDIEMQSLEWRQALIAYEQIRLLNPEDEPTRRTIIDLHFRLRQVSQALAEISSYTKALVENRKVNEVVVFLEKLAEEYPDEPHIIRNLGDAYRQTGRSEDALVKYDAAAEEFLMKNNRQAAAETIMAILTLNPPNAAEYQQMLSQLR